MASVERMELAPGLNISRVLNGLWQIADQERDGNKLDPESSATLMAPFVESGFTTFDMADHYGSAEQIAGCFRSGHPLGSDSQMLTKWVPPPGRLTRQEVRTAVQRSLDRLQAGQLDLLQFHAWHYPDASWLDSLFWLDELRSEGLIKALGVTNFDAAHLRIAVASGIPIVSNQVSYSLLDQRAAGALAGVCAAYNVRLLAYGTLAGGFLSERWLAKPEPQAPASWSQMKYKRFIDSVGGWEAFQSLLSEVAKVAARHRCPISTVASRYILDQPGVAGVILGTRLDGSNHVQDNLGIFELQLDEQDREDIAAAISQIGTVPGDCGDEYRKPPFLTASGDLGDHLDSIPLPFEPHHDDKGCSRVFSGTPWEGFAGYCRAVRRGDLITVSGTTATHGDRTIGGTDAAAQTHFVIDKIEAAIESLGGCLEDVMRTRIFVNDIACWEAVARAHGERFGPVQPANTLVQARLVGDEYLVEIEADAVCAREPG